MNNEINIIKNSNNLLEMIMSFFKENINVIIRGLLYFDNEE